jgi:CRP-like cAMP-binding protein/Zn-dependent protease
VFVHELGHATYLVHHGRRVRGAGFRIYLGSPAFFVDSSDALMLDRPTRIRQSLAGPYFESVVTGACAIVLWATGSSPIASVLFTFVSLNYFILLLNLVPFLELDGYWVLADLLRFRDLRRRAMALVRKDAWTALRDRHRLSRAETALAIYGLLGVVFTVFALGLAIWFWHDTFGPFVDQLWNEGVFGRIAFLALVLVVAAPLVQALAAAVAGVGRALLQLGRRLRFRAQRAWRIRGAQVLDDSPLFGDLAEDVLRDIAGRVERISAAAGTTIVHQGEAADAMYAVGRGELDVIEQDGDNERVLARLGPGDTFGELGLASGSPRAATVRASTRVELFAIDKATFDRLLADHVRLPSMAATVQQLADLQALPPYAHLSARELRDLYEHGRWLHVAPGQVLVREGDEPGGFFVIGSGRMGVVRGGREIGELGPGQGFGELALLNDAPRAATVVARTPAHVFEVSRQGFDRVVAAAFDRPSRTSHVTSFQRA